MASNVLSTPRVALGNKRRPSLRRSFVRVCAAAETPFNDEQVELGKSGLKVSNIGVGAWSWGDRSGYWGWESGYGKSDCAAAYTAAMNAGLTFIDTAEVYGFGKSEELIKDFVTTSASVHGDTRKPVIATKFAPLPWRFTSSSVVDACKASLGRLGIQKMGLYIQHWPGFGTSMFSNDAYLEGLAECVKQGLTTAVGVSNFNADRLRKAHAFLASRGVPLSSNQVQYSLLYRAPETNGVVDVCKDLGITLVAYSPLAQGMLTGKYAVGKPKPEGPRGAVFSDSRLMAAAPVVRLLGEIGVAHGGKTPGQVAINWLLCKGALPIPGAKNAKQVADINAARGWRLTAAEVAALDASSKDSGAMMGAPFENW